MKRMWSKHDLLRIAGVEITGKDTMKRMWSKHDLLRIAGVEITGKDTMKRMWSKHELIDLLSSEQPSIPPRYVQTTFADFDASDNYTGTESYIILPENKPSGYQIVNPNVIGVATNGDYLTSCFNMFRNNPSLYLELDYLNTSNVVNMGNMFRDSQATTLDLSSFNTSNVTNMDRMFYSSQATTLDLSSFDTSNVTSMVLTFVESQATTGYARTQTDADNFNSSSNKPAALVFEVK